MIFPSELKFLQGQTLLSSFRWWNPCQNICSWKEKWFLLHVWLVFIRIPEKSNDFQTPLSTFPEWFWIYSGVFTSHPQHSPAHHCTWTGHETRTRFSGFAWSSWRCWPLQHVWRPGVSDSVCWADLQNLRKNLVPTLGFICAFYSEISKCSWWLFKVE